MAKQNGAANSSLKGNSQEAEALKNRLMFLPERTFDQELKKLSPVAVQELLALTAQITEQPKRRRAKQKAEDEAAPKPVRTEASVRASLLKIYFDSMGERKLDRELKKISSDDLHLLICATAYENAKKNGARR